MCAVLEYVEEWHGGSGEAVNEQGFELTLAKVQDDEGQRERLQRGGRR